MYTRSYTIIYSKTTFSPQHLSIHHHHHSFLLFSLSTQDPQVSNRWFPFAYLFVCEYNPDVFKLLCIFKRNKRVLDNISTDIGKSSNWEIIKLENMAVSNRKSLDKCLLLLFMKYRYTYHTHILYVQLFSLMSNQLCKLYYYKMHVTPPLILL